MIGFRLRAVRAVVVVLVMCGVPAAASAQGPVITSPSTATVLPAGPDFATDVLANPWDFSDPNDLSPFPDDIRGWTISNSLGRSVGRTAYLNGGKFVGTTTPDGENFATLLYRGGQPWVPSQRDISGAMDHQAIPTALYGKLSVAMAVDAVPGGQMVAFAYSSPYLGENERSRGVVFNVARPGTHIYTVDLATGFWTNEHGVAGTPTIVSGGSPVMAWNDASLVRGFALRPMSGGDSRNVEIDWARLTQRDGLNGAVVLPLTFTGCTSQEYNVEVSAAGISPQVIHTAKASSTGTTTANVN